MSRCAEARYYVLAWEGDGTEDDALYTRRSLFVRHEMGEYVTPQMVMDQLQAEVGSYPAGRYRIYPAATTLDVTVESKVVKA